MRFALSALLLCMFLGLLIAGLVSVLREMLARDFRPAQVPEPARRAARRMRLDFDLTRDLDDPLRRQVEPIDDLRGVAVQKGE